MLDFYRLSDLECPDFVGTTGPGCCPKGQRHINHHPIDHSYKCHENTNLSRVPQLSEAPIHTSKLKYVPNLLQA